MTEPPHAEPLHPAHELASLCAGLQAASARAARRGRRHVAAPPARAPEPSAPTQPEPNRQSAPPPASARRELAPQPAPARPEPARRPTPQQAAPRPEPAPRPADTRATPARSNGSGGPPQLEDRVAALRARAEAAPNLESLAREVAGCTACGLCETRKQTVFSDGSGRARVMFVGEAPGADEDEQGLPFVGRAGQLLTDIITKGMGLAREDVSIANVLKCRPPGNRDPQPEEKALCTTWLMRQIELVDPDVIVPLGRHAAGHLLGSDATMGRMRGQVHRLGRHKVVPTYHPAFLLRSPHMKKDTWADIQLAMRELGLSKGSD